MKKIIDVCCGGRMFWFDKKNPNTVFIDNRKLKKHRLSNGANFEVKPDMIMDFRQIKFPNRSFNLVVFDPPHYTMTGNGSWLKEKYGVLDKNNWKEDLKKGFSECFRILKKNGVLIFKWNEYKIPLSEILKLTKERPLFGHRSGKASKTHWLCFMKN